MHRFAIAAFLCFAPLASHPGAVPVAPGPTSAPQATSRAWIPDRVQADVALQGAGALAWAVSFGSTQTDWVNRVIRRADGSLVAAGFLDRAAAGPDAWDGFIHEFDESGAAVRTRRFGGPGLDALWAVREGVDGTIAAAGFSDTDSAGDTDLWLVLVGPEGDTVTEHSYGGPAAEVGFDLVASREGGYLLVGQTESYGAGEPDVFLVRTDARGQELWRRTFGGSEVDRGFYGVQTSDGGFVIAGVTGPQGAYDMLVLKVTASGEEAWRQVIGGEGNDPNHGINLLPDGRIVVVGYGQSHGATQHDLVAAVLSSEGELLSHELLGAPGDDRAINSITARDGGTWIIGYTTSPGHGGWDAMLARLGPDGRFEPWMAMIGTPHDDQGTTVLELPDGSLLIGGYTQAPSAGAAPSDLLLARLDPSTLVRSSEGVAHRRLR